MTTYRSTRLDQSIPLDLASSEQTTKESLVVLSLDHLQLDILERQREVLGRGKAGACSTCQQIMCEESHQRG